MPVPRALNIVSTASDCFEQANTGMVDDELSTRDCCSTTVGAWLKTVRVPMSKETSTSHFLPTIKAFDEQAVQRLQDGLLNTARFVGRRDIASGTSLCSIETRFANHLTAGVSDWLT